MTIHKCKNVTRWLILVLGILAAASYLYGAIFSAWMSNGPPNKYPEAWAHHALLNFCFAMAALLGSTAAFRIIRSFPKIGVLSVALALMALAFIAMPSWREFWDSDRCFDSGGRWNKPNYQCER